MENEIMQASRTLPDGYRKIGTLDIKNNKRLQLLLNLAGVVGLLISGWLFLMILARLRPNDIDGVFRFEIRSLGEMVLLIGIVLVLQVVVILLHEAVHGVFFWLFTRSQPKFAFHWIYAYAAAPDWYLPRNLFLITTLAPLVLISLGGVILFTFAPAAWLLPTWFMLVLNASGAVGDIAVAVWLVRQTPACLAQDRGDAVTLFAPEK
jgi:hypothetical protein